jgi:hypothetical protein
VGALRREAVTQIRRTYEVPQARRTSIFISYKFNADERPSTLTSSASSAHTSRTAARAHGMLCWFVSDCGLACCVVDSYASAWQPMQVYKRLCQCMVTRASYGMLRRCMEHHATSWKPAPVHGTPWYHMAHCASAHEPGPLHGMPHRGGAMSCRAPPCAGMGARGSGMPWVACGGMVLAHHGVARYALACPPISGMHYYFYSL